MNIRRDGVVLLIATFAVFGLAWTTETNAQPQSGAAPQGPPPLRSAVTTTQVKPDMLTTWQDLIRNEAVPALKKAGVPWRWVFANSPLGGPGFTFVTVTPIANYAQYDQPNPLQRALGVEGLAKYNAKLRPTIVSTSTVIHRLIENASLQSFSITPPSLARVATMQLLPGKGQEFAAITTAEFLPALKKAGVTDYLVFATDYGAPNTQRTVITMLAKYADLDGPPPLNRALGAEGAQQLNQKRGALVASTEATVLRFVPELSYGAPARPSTRPTP